MWLVRKDERAEDASRSIDSNDSESCVSSFSSFFFHLRAGADLRLLDSSSLEHRNRKSPLRDPFKKEKQTRHLAPSLPPSQLHSALPSDPRWALLQEHLLCSSSLSFSSSTSSSGRPHLASLLPLTLLPTRQSFASLESSRRERRAQHPTSALLVSPSPSFQTHPQIQESGLSCLLCCSIPSSFVSSSTGKAFFEKRRDGLCQCRKDEEEVSRAQN